MASRKERKERAEKRVDQMIYAIIEVVACQRVTVEQAVRAACKSKEGAHEAHLWRRAGLLAQQELN